MQNKLIIVVLISLFSFGYTVSGQKLINSPYSRFNLGTLEQQGSFRSLSMGGTGTAMRDNSSIYFTNPASYSSFDTTSFIFDFGVDYGRNYISDGVTKFSSDDFNFHHLIMGFPIARGWGMALGVVPMSSGFYEISANVLSTDPGYDPSIGEYTVVHAGDGGITKFFIGTGLKLNKNFSVGANMVLLSGGINRTNQFIFASSTDYYSVFHNNNAEKLEMTGINFDIGLQYTAKLKNNYFLNIGASVATGNNYNTKYNQLALKYTAFSVGDTVSSFSDNSAKTFIPATYKFGVSFGKKDKFTAGIDYASTKWSAAKIPGTTGYAADTKSILIGAEYIPDKFSNYSFINRLEYRIGGHFGDNYLILNGEQIKEYGACVGIGIPLNKTFSKANLFFDFTRKTGLISNSVHNEDYFRTGISLNLYDWWFIKRKYE